MTKQQQIEMGKEYRTRDGRKVEVGTTTDGGSFPVMAQVYDYTSQNPEFKYYTIYGQYTYSDTQKHWDLIEVDPTLISMDKKYRTRDGRAVRVLAVDVNHSFKKVAAAVTFKDGSEEHVHSYNQYGMICGDQSSNADLVEVTPFDNMKIDDPVVVTIGSQGSVGRVFHFAGTTEDGRPKVWSQGRTSLTVKNKVCDWWVPVGCEPYVAE